MKKIRPIYAVLIVAALARLLFLFRYHDVWWDSAVYVAMGKYLWSGGASGFWEHIRPILWPAILGFFWWIKLDPLILGRILEFLFSLGAIYLTYQIAAHVFSRKAAFIASIVLSFSSVFFFFTFRLYTELPAVFLVLLGFYSYLKDRHFCAGLSIGAAFLAKFPAGIFILPLLFIDIRKWRRTGMIVAGFAIPLALYALFSYVRYGSFISSLLLASAIIKQVLGCNLLNQKPWYFYFQMLLKDNIFNIFSLAGIYHSFRRITRDKLLLLFSLLFPLIYFLQLECKDYRYIILFLPFVAMFAGEGIVRLLKVKKRQFVLIAMIIFFISAIFTISYYLQNEPSEEHWSVEFFSYPQDYPDAKIASTNPWTALYTDQKILPLYYPLYNSTLAQDIDPGPDIGIVMLDSCWGGMICPPDDAACPAATASLISRLGSARPLLYHKIAGPCEYWIFGDHAEN